jgi:Protein of unknown function (DUF2851)
LISASENFYARWRAQSCGQNILRDEQFPPERLAQSIWQHQRLRRGELKTTSGQSVRIFHPGFANLEGGPDFRGAVLQIGDDAPCSGDVEIDLRPNGWRAHGHDRNPNFQNVLLHVVWDDAGGHLPAHKNALERLSPATLCIKDVLDAPLAELRLSLENESLRSLPENLRGRCCAPLRELEALKLTELIEQAARVRLENKGAQICARAKNAGWGQALWEYLFRALGYKHNLWPMQHLADQKMRLLASWENLSAGEALLELQARLLGASGLLPDELTRVEKSSDGYLRRVWDIWWRERDAFSDVVLPRTAWRFHGLRPANHPRRRLALASHWLANKKFILQIENWMAAGKGAGAPTAACRRLMEILQVECDDFW